MFTSFQIIIVSVVAILTLLLVVIGAKIYQILSEFGGTLQKINKLLANKRKMDSLLSWLDFNKRNNIEKPKKNKLWLGTEDIDIQKEEHSERQRFFSRHGKTLN